MEARLQGCGAGDALPKTLRRASAAKSSRVRSKFTPEMKDAWDKLIKTAISQFEICSFLTALTIRGGRQLWVKQIWVKKSSDRAIF